MTTRIVQPTSLLHVEPLRLEKAPEGAKSFASVLQTAMNQVEQTGADANRAVEMFLSGEGGELHSTMLATQRASLQFDMFMQVRNKVVQAYQEITRMQL